MQYALKYSSHQTVRPLARLSPNGQTPRSSLTKRSDHSLVSHQTVKPLARLSPNGQTTRSLRNWDMS